MCIRDRTKEALIRVENLTKRFGELEVLKGITEEIHEGEVVSIIGPSGGGKSTFLRCLNLLEVPTSGKVIFEGVNIADKSVDLDLHRRKIGMVFQHFNVFPHLSVLDNITITPVSYTHLSGHQEIVLSGIHTGRYGRDINTNLTQLMKRMCKEVKGLRRIRISSIEMNEISDELLTFMQKEPKIARHLHIPIQSANNEVLKNMHRPYDVEWFKERVKYIRSLMPDISISSDVIVGFPQESEEQFVDTMENIKQMEDVYKRQAFAMDGWM